MKANSVCDKSGGDTYAGMAVKLSYECHARADLPGGLCARAPDEEADRRALIHIPGAFGWKAPTDPRSEHRHEPLRETLETTPLDEEYDSPSSRLSTCACSSCRFGTDFGAMGEKEAPHEDAAGGLAATKSKSPLYIEFGELSWLPRYMEEVWADERRTVPAVAELGGPRQTLSIVRVSDSAPDCLTSSLEPWDIPTCVAAEQEMTLPSLGAELHHVNECTPCKFYRSKRGCFDGAFCKYCHYPHENMSYSSVRKLVRLKGLAKHGLAKPSKKAAGKTPEPDQEVSTDTTSCT